MNLTVMMLANQMVPKIPRAYPMEKMIWKAYPKATMLENVLVIP